MKLIKQILCFALAVLMLLSVVACGGGPAAGGNNDDDDDDDDVDDDNATTTEDRIDELPDIDMNKEEIIIRSWTQSVNQNSFKAERDGDVINNAVYDRNAALEKRLNCVVTVNENIGQPGSMGELDELTNLAGQKSYHLVTNASYVITTAAVQGFFIDLAKQERIMLQKAYYDDGYNHALSAGTRQYLVTGKITLSWYRYQVVTMFNRNLFKQKGIEYPYQTVLDGNGYAGGWTLAKQMEVANLMYADLNQDGKYDVNDQYGFYHFVGSGSSQTDGYMSAWQLTLVEKNAENYFQVNGAYEPTPWVSAVNEFLDLAGAVGSYVSDEIDNNVVSNKFAAGEAGMITFRMYGVEQDAMVSLSRDKEGYGIIPLAKDDEDQTEYNAYVQDQVLLFGIPNTMKDNDRLYATHFLEALASESYNVTVPAYYEKALTKKYVIDEPSKAMIQIIDSQIVVDPTNVWTSYFNLDTTVLRQVYAEDKKINDLLAEKMAGGTMQTSVDKLNDLLKKLDEDLTAIGE
ncbi:MAG: hypothetical protein IJW16_06335 [Clostridia bacterium]|nr:hypothetical protein [Clostridia bacterium]